MHTLRQLTSAIITENVSGPDNDMPITALTADSRQVVPGAMFVAVRGPLADGHDYIASALEHGATAIVCETPPPAGLPAGTACIRVADASVALGLLASEWYGNPSRHLTLVGVTGTNGKTTIATLLYEMARLSGQRAGLLSTVENRVDSEVFPTANTTPSPLETNRLLALMVERGCTFAAMEVSSHGMVQNRTIGLHFAGGIFTNLTRDHLDYHGTFAAYLAAKQRFFDLLPPTAFALYNADDRNGAIMVQNTAAHRASYGLSGSPDFLTTAHPAPDMTGMELTIDGIAIHTPFSGRFNASNLTAVFAAWLLLGHAPEETAVALSRLQPVAGRFQTFRSADGVTAVVDYAHTPDALRNVLSTIAEATNGHIITITGAGGNRDHGKRPQMGHIAASMSATLIITSDNPRDENPADIAADIAAGITRDDTASVLTILDRTEAIATAIDMAAPGDVVLIAGKGHETYQEFDNHRRTHFDDREQALRALRSRTKA